MSNDFLRVSYYNAVSPYGYLFTIDSTVEHNL